MLSQESFSGSAEWPKCRHAMTPTAFSRVMCGKPARFIVTTRGGQILYRCGVHVRRYRVRIANGDETLKSIEALRADAVGPGKHLDAPSNW